MPVGAVLASERVVEAVARGGGFVHGFTFSTIPSRRRRASPSSTSSSARTSWRGRGRSARRCSRAWKGFGAIPTWATCAVAG